MHLFIVMIIKRKLPSNIVRILIVKILFFPVAHAWHLYTIRPKSRDELQKCLIKRGVQSMIHYPVPPNNQEGYLELSDMYYPVSEKIHDEILSIPISSAIDGSQDNEIIDSLNRF